MQPARKFENHLKSKPVRLGAWPPRSQKRMKFFTKRLIGLRVESHSVYMVFRRELFRVKKSSPFPDDYIETLRKSVEQTVSPSVWEMISKPKKSEEAEYRSYTERVRESFIDEFGYTEQKDEVKIGVYHCDMLVISFPKKKNTTYPFYYRGIQLKAL